MPSIGLNLQVFTGNWEVSKWVNNFWMGPFPPKKIQINEYETKSFIPHGSCYNAALSVFKLGYAHQEPPSPRLKMFACFHKFLLHIRFNTCSNMKIVNIINVVNVFCLQYWYLFSTLTTKPNGMREGVLFFYPLSTSFWISWICHLGRS